MRFNDELLQYFITTFYGSGNYSGDYWFVGMEEGGGASLDQVKLRLNAWQDLGEQDLVDMYDFHVRINYPEYFTDPVKLQRTWLQQARIILSSKGLLPTIPALKAYQRDVIGRKGSETCLLELLPLASPSTSVWNYGHWSYLPYLKDRKTYLEYCIPWRCEHIRAQIDLYQPKYVIFLGTGYSQFWNAIAGQNNIFENIGAFQAARSKNTLFIISKHPSSRGITNAYFETIGSYILNSKR